MDALLRYCLVGVSNTVLAVCVMTTFALLGFHYAIYSTFGYVAAFTWSYVFNGLFTFKVNGLSIKGFMTFLAINAPLLALVNAAQVIMIDGVGMAEWMGIAVSAVCYTIVGFCLNRRITYGRALSP
jgi:putative flippase GtrA